MQNYKPPPQDFTDETFQMLQNFSEEVNNLMQSQKQMLVGGSYLEVLKQKGYIEKF